MTRVADCDICGGTGRVELPDYIDTPPRIVQDRGVCGGEPRIDGTRITVSALRGLALNRGLGVADIARLPELTEAHVQAALDSSTVRKGTVASNRQGGQP